MQAADTESMDTKRTVVSQIQHRRATYSKVMDKRKRPIRGLWERNGRFYAQLTVEDQVTGIKRVKRVPLEGVSSDAQAVAKLQELLTQRRKGALPVLKRTPLFADYAKQYFDYYEKVKDAKRESTIYTERIIINHWTDVRVFDTSQNGIEYVTKCLDPKNRYEFNKFGLAQTLTFSPAFVRVIRAQERRDGAFCNAGQEKAA